MILYFANREMQILGQASTTLPNGFVILDDLKSEDVDTGVATFECKIGFDKENRLKLEEMTNAGNYLLRSDEDESEFYTIIDSEIDTKNQEVYIYAEDAGLDLLNEVVGAFEATESHTAEWYINKYTNDSGFEIGINEIPSTSTRKLSWDGEATATERLASIATQFGGYEISFSFAIKGMEVSNKYINIYKERGKELEELLMLNRDIDRIITKKSVANLATAFLCTGGIPKGKDKPITLEGYEYDDGDFYVSGKYVKSREAVNKWSRYVWNKEPNQQTGYAGHIVRRYTYDTTSQKTLCSHAITELKKICDMEVNYEVDIKKLPDTVRIGDRVNIVDDAGELYLSARILQLDTSIVNGSYKATLGEYLIKDSGISQKVEDLAAQFAKLAANRTFYTWIAYADDETGAGISPDPAGKEYMGTAANQASEEVDISDPSIFKWSKIKGEQGPPGDPGTSGKGIESESKEYYLSTSSEEVVGGTWQSDIPEWQSGRYIWSRNVITWTDGTVSYTDPILENTLNHVSETADYASSQAAEAKNTAQTANEAAASAQNAANEAINKAETAQASAAESQAAVSAAQSEITAINTEVTLLKDDTAAIRSEVSGQIETINETLSADYSKKTEVSTIEANLKAEISKSSAEIKTTLSEDYAAKSELAELQGSLQTQITQNAEGISINASKVEKLETDTAEAQTQITAAQTAAQNAQKSADEAKTAARKAQSDATTANNAAAAADAKAQSAQKAADDAQTDLNNAKANLEEVTNRVDATEDEITAAQAAVDKAQKAADDAQAAADTAKTNAATAQSAASAAQTKADSAAQAAASAQAAADKAQSDLEELTSRVTKAETSITNNAEAIKLAATKEEVATTLAGYSTTTEMNAVIEQKANGITASVSATYATKTENQAALSAAEAAQDDIDNLEIGGRNLVTNSKNLKNFKNEALSYISMIFTDTDVTVTCTKSVLGIYYDISVEGASYYTLSFNAADISGTCKYSVGGDGSVSIWAGLYKYTNLEEGRTEVTFKTNAATTSARIYFSSHSGSDSFKLWNVKLEKGNKATDWTPAPEDVDAANQAVADDLANNYSTTTEMNSAIEQKANSITSSVAATYATKAENEDTLSVANTAKTTAEQTADKFTWLVASGTSSSNFTLTDRVASLLSSEFQIDALTTFKNSAMDGTSTVINGGAIKANTISADKLNVTDLSALGATIGGFTIGTSALYNGTTSLAGADNSVYLGLDGISCGTKFKVDKAGALTANDAVITGNTTITGNLITNGNVLICSENMKEDPYSGYIEFLTSSININGGQTLSLRATRGVDIGGALTVSDGISGDLTVTGQIISTGRHTLANNTSVSFLNSSGTRVRGIGLGNTDNILIGADADTAGMYGYITAQNNIVFYAGTSHDQCFASIYDSGKRYFQSKPIYDRTTSSGTAVRVNSNGTLYRYSSSSMRYKEEITCQLNEELNPERLYDLNVWQYKYREGHLDKGDQRYGKTHIGLIAEDVKQHYPIAANFNEDGDVEDWSERYLIPPMLKLIQMQHAEIEAIKAELEEIRAS